MFFSQFLNREYFNNSIKEYILAVSIFIAITFAGLFFKNYILQRVKKLTKQTNTKLDDLLVNTVNAVGLTFYVMIGFYFATQNLNLPEIIKKIILGGTILVLAFFIVNRIQEIVMYTLKELVEKKKSEDGESFDPSIIHSIGLFVNILIWLIAIIVILQNFNINVGTLIGGLGIGGIAIAFALQSILADIFASFTIYFDKPFKTGDFVDLKEDMGTVVSVGIKSTRIKTLRGEELVVSNKELTETRVRNFGRMESRRVVFTFGVEYETTAEQLRKISKIVQNIIKNLDICDFDRAHFVNFGDFSLNFEVVYHIKNSDYTIYMDIQQKINLELKEIFEQEGIQFAFPTQTIILKK